MKEEENGDIVADGGSVPRSSIRINVAPDLNNHLQSLDLFRSMIIKKKDQNFVIVIGWQLDSNRIVIAESSDSYRIVIV